MGRCTAEPWLSDLSDLSDRSDTVRTCRTCWTYRVSANRRTTAHRATNSDGVSGLTRSTIGASGTDPSLWH